MTRTELESKIKEYERYYDDPSVDWNYVQLVMLRCDMEDAERAAKSII